MKPSIKGGDLLSICLGSKRLVMPAAFTIIESLIFVAGESGQNKYFFLALKEWLFLRLESFWDASWSPNEQLPVLGIKIDPFSTIEYFRFLLMQVRGLLEALLLLFLRVTITLDDGLSIFTLFRICSGIFLPGVFTGVYYKNDEGAELGTGGRLGDA